MNPIPSSLLPRISAACLLPSLLALGLACGDASEAPLGAREQPISAPDGGDPTDGPACEAGAPMQGPLGEECQVVARGLCFTTSEAACACAGCALVDCAIAESFPGQAFCQSGDPGPDPDAPVSSGPVSSGPGGGVDGASGSTSPAGPGCGEPGEMPPLDPSEPSCAGGTSRDPNSEAPCDFLVAGLCFDDAAAACACAGCDAASCLVLESYPAQISCQ